MATYYVTTSGLTTNTGLTVNSPWSLGKALSSTLPGDEVYIAPGEYFGNFTLSVSGSSGSPISFIGDPLLSKNWTGINAGEVIITGYESNISDPVSTNALISATSRSYVNFSYLTFRGKTLNEIYPNNGLGLVNLTTCNNMNFNKCFFNQMNSGTAAIFITNYNNNLFNFSITNCIGYFNNSTYYLVAIFSNQTATTPVTIKNCLVNNAGLYSFYVYGGRTDIPGSLGGAIIQNCTCINGNYAVLSVAQSGNKDQVTNCLIACTNSFGAFHSGINENYNRVISGTRTNTPVGANSLTGGTYGIELGSSYFYGLPNIQHANLSTNSQNAGIGTNTNILSPDIYNNAWQNPPAVGASTYTLLSQGSLYIPSDRTNINLTLFEGSTSQSIQVYLGVVGLTHNNSNLNVKYTRLNSSPVNVTLTSQTPTGSWVSGGFCAIDAVNMPGYYRFDVPDTALIIGVKSVTVAFQGFTSNTNGTFASINLQKMQIDMAQPVPTSNTAQTVGDALNAARAQGFGKWTINGNTLSLYAPDGSTIIKSFTLDSAKFPSQRV
jgi:hypothetical protein